MSTLRRAVGVSSLLGLCWLPLVALAAPVSVAGFEFANGEDDFAQSAVVVSGVVTGSSLAQVQTILTGSAITDSVRVIAPDIAEIELTFGPHQILNSAGADAVIFELSGVQPAGTPDPTEQFEVSLLHGGSFTAYQVVVPVSTGEVDPLDPTLDVFAVLLDLADYGLAAGETSDRLRIRLVDNGFGHRSADPTAVGLLHSVPEPTALVLLGLGALVSRARGR